MSQSVTQKYPFYTVLSHLSDMYGIDMPEDVFEVMAMSGWEKIGNKEYRMYRISLKPERCEDGLGWYVKVPCNCDIIESITANWESYQKTSAVVDFPGNMSLPNENFNEYMKFDVNSLYQSGRFIKYKLLGDRILINEEYPAVNILYKGIYLDDEGLPYLSIKEVEALASYCAYCDMKKKSYQTMNGNLASMAGVEMQNWMRLCDAARVPQYINQNEMDEILDAKTSWNRKMYGKSFKPVQ
jgi:hypothetical protein